MLTYLGIVLSMAIAKVIYIFSTALEVKNLGKFGVPLDKMLWFGLLMLPLFYVAALAKWTGHNLAYQYTNWWGMSITYELINIAVIVAAGLIFFNKPVGYHQYMGLFIAFMGMIVFHLGGK